MAAEPPPPRIYNFYLLTLFDMLPSEHERTELLLYKSRERPVKLLNTAFNDTPKTFITTLNSDEFSTSTGLYSVYVLLAIFFRAFLNTVATANAPEASASASPISSEFFPQHSIDHADRYATFQTRILRTPRASGLVQVSRGANGVVEPTTHT